MKEFFTVALCFCFLREVGNLLINAMFQDDNFSLSLLNELSVKYGIQTHLSHAPLPQKLEELREYLRREIKKELKVTSSEMIILY